MTRLPKRRLLLEAFKALGYPSVELRTRKYVGFAAPSGKVLLVGKSAALRVKQFDARVDESNSLTDSRFYKALLIVGERAGCYTTTEQARADLNYEWTKRS